VCGCFNNCMGVLVMCVNLFTMFRIDCTVFCTVSFIYVLFIFDLSVLVVGLLALGKNSIAVIIIITPRCMGELAPLYVVDSALVLTNPGVQ